MTVFFFIRKTWLTAFLGILPSLTAFTQNLNTKQLDSLLLDGNRVIIQQMSYTEAIQWNASLLREAEKQKYSKGIVWAHLNIANRYWNYGEPDKSIKHLDTARAISNTTQMDNHTIARIYRDYSKVYNSIKLYDLGLEYNFKASDYGKKIENNNTRKTFLSSAYSSRANLYYGKNQPDSALKYLNQASQLSVTPFNLALIANHYIEYEPANISAALPYLDRAFLLLKDSANSHATTYTNSVVNYCYGYYYMRKSDYNEAVKYLETAKMFGEKKGNVQHLLSVYKLLAQSYKNLGDIEEEKNNLASYTQLKDSIEKAQAESINLSLKTIGNEKNEVHKGTTKIVWILGVVLAVILILLLYLYFENRRKKKLLLSKEKILAQKEEETEGLKRKVNEINEDVIRMAKDNDAGFLAKFQEVYPEMTNRLWRINPGLSQPDLSFCALIWLGFSSKEIAQYTFMQHRSVQTKKNRLRKKLNLEPEIDLYVFLRSVFDVPAHPQTAGDKDQVRPAER